MSLGRGTAVSLPSVDNSKVKVVPFSPRQVANMIKNSSADANSFEHMDNRRSHRDYGTKDAITVAQFIHSIKEGNTLQVNSASIEGSTLQKEKSLAKKEKVQAIESFLTQNCASHVLEPQRGINLKKAIDDMSELFPSLSGCLLTLWRYLKEFSMSFENLKESQRLEIKHLEKSVYKKYETFFEDKILQLLREKKKTELNVNQLRDEVLTLRKDRDEDLMKSKETVMIRLNDCERKEDEFRSFRKLIASVFKTNEGLVSRIEDLETLLRKHRIEVPRVAGDLYAYGKPSKEGTSKLREDDDVKKITDQVPISFIEASRQEMNLARLSLQRELLNSAFDERTAYRLQVNGLHHENSNLQLQVDTFQSRVNELEIYIHQKRFLSSEPVGDDAGPMTPRPRDVPFTIQTELGVDLKNSTAKVVAELAAVGTNLKHQLNSTVMCLRQLSSAVEWMEEETLLKVADDRNVQGVLPTFSTSTWDSIPHFLRTHVEPNVPNLSWTESDTGAILYEIFSNYTSLRSACRFLRDSKMLAPRVYQLFERSHHPLVRLDATQQEVNQSEENVPFGYVVSHYISRALVSASNESYQFKILQPGTLNPSYVYHGKDNAVEMEFAKFGYNLWFWAQRYKESQPLCRLFLDVVDGRASIGIFDIMQNVIKYVDTRIRKFDTDGSNSFTYNKLVGCVLKIVGDMDTQVGRCATLAVTETFQDNQVSIVAGRVVTAAILADEQTVDRDPSPRISRLKSVAGIRTRKSVVGELPARGASVLTRFWRRLVIQRHEKVFALIERIIGHLVVESQVVIGLFLLPIPKALKVLMAFDSDPSLYTDEYVALKYPKFPEVDPLKQGDTETDWDPQGSPRFTGKYAKFLAERKASLRDTKDISFINIFNLVVSELPRLSRCVHFPFLQQRTLTNVEQPSEAEDKVLEQTTSAQDDKKELRSPGKNIGKTGAKKLRKGMKKSLKAIKADDSKTSPVPEAVPNSLTISTDKELVEWFGFCFALRQQAIPLTESIFVEASQLSQNGGQQSNARKLRPTLFAYECST